MNPKITYSLLIIAAIALFLHVLIYVSFGIALIPFPYDYDQAEGFELNNAVLLSNGECPYCNNDTYPYFASGYPPVFHFLMVPFVWIFGPALWYGRLIIFISTFVTAGTIGYVVWRSEKQLLIAAIAGFAFLASNYIYHIGPLLRQHLLMVTFESVAIAFTGLLIVRGQDLSPRRMIILVSILLLAGFTKQLAYSTCIAIILWLFLRNPRQSIYTGLLLGAAALVIFTIGLLLTQGHWWLNIIVSNQNEYIPEQFTGLIRQFVTLHWPLLLLASLSVLYELYFERLSVYSLWFIVSLISTVGAGKWGAGDSYFATTLAATCILAGLFISRILRGSWHISIIHSPWYSPTSGWISLVSVGLIILYAGLVFKFPTSGPIFGTVSEFLNIQPKPGHRYPFYDSADWTVGYAVTGHFPAPEDYENGNRILDIVKNTQNPIISEDATFAILAQREVVTNPIQLMNLWHNGAYDPSQLIEQIEKQAFGLIIRRGDFFPPPVLHAIDSHYRIDTTIEMNGFNYQLWIPTS